MSGDVHRPIPVVFELVPIFTAYYDRVMVMDEGQVAEFDTVLNLFDREDSIFRSLCDEANLQRADIVRIRSEHIEAVGS